MSTRPWVRKLDYALIRSLGLPVDQGGQGIPVKVIAARFGCVVQTVYYILNPEKRAQYWQLFGRRSKYHCQTTADLLRVSDYHYEHLEHHQECLDQIETEIQRRRRKTGRS